MFLLGTFVIRCPILTSFCGSGGRRQQLALDAKQVWMCTGDHRVAAEAVARECGIDAGRVATWSEDTPISL